MKTVVVPEPSENAFEVAVVALESGRLQDAEMALSRIVEASPLHAGAKFLLGLCVFRMGRHEAGLRNMRQAITLNKKMPPAHYNLGLALAEVGRFEDALAELEAAIHLWPQYGEAHLERGDVLQRMGRTQESMVAYDSAIRVQPNLLLAYHRRAVALHRLGRFEDALAGYELAIAHVPNHADSYADRGLLLQQQQRFDEAMTSYDHAIALNPNHAGAHSNRANLLYDRRRLTDALAGYDRALALAPDFPQAHNNRGLVLRDLWQFDAALAAFDRAIALDANFAGAHGNRGSVFIQLQDYVAALGALEVALRLDPALPYALGDWIHVKMNLCDWDGVAPALHRLLEKLEVGERVTPFAAMALPTSPAQQYSAARAFVSDRVPSRVPIRAKTAGVARERIRIAYVSSDFRNHPVAYLTAGLFEHHDRTKFEVLAISSGSASKDSYRKRLELAFDRFIDVGSHSDDEVETLACNLDIDIAIDLNGATGGGRMGVFAGRIAPLQVSYLGCPGTSGADYMDYLLADRFVIPPEQRQYFSEKIVYLPHCFQANDASKVISDRLITRADVALPEDAFVFCCFNNTYKITPEMFDTWMRILLAVKDGVLWLAPTSAKAIANLIVAAKQRGVNPERLVFAQRVPLAEYLAQYRLADLFLDTAVYNGGTTASDALWAGLPVLTCPGDTFARRMAGSLLHAIGLPEMIAATPAQYETMAVQLATAPVVLAGLRDKLGRNRLTYPLFDTVRFTRDIEQAYLGMWRRHRLGLAPEHFAVAASCSAH